MSHIKYAHKVTYNIKILFIFSKVEFYKCFVRKKNKYKISWNKDASREEKHYPKSMGGL